MDPTQRVKAIIARLKERADKGDSAARQLINTLPVKDAYNDQEMNSVLSAVHQQYIVNGNDRRGSDLPFDPKGADAVLTKDDVRANLGGPSNLQPTGASGGGRPADPAAPNFDVTDQDRKLVEQSIGAAGDIARRQLEATLPTIMDRATARSGAQGIVGGSGEIATRALAGAEATRSFADLMSQQQAAGGQALMGLPLQRAGMTMDFNNSLWNRYIQSATLDFQKQSHADDMALQREQMRYQQQQQRSSQLGGLLGLLGRGVGAYATGGWSEVAKMGYPK